MHKENPQIDIIKASAKAKEAEKEAKSARKQITVKIHRYNTETRQIEMHERVLKSGKEGSFLGRLGLIMLFIAAELAVLIVLYVRFLQNFLWFLLIPYGIGIIFACRVAVSAKNPDSKIAWILFLLIFAPVAVIVYLLAGEMTASPLKSFKLKKINEKTRFLEKGPVPDTLPRRVKHDCAYIQNTSDYVPYYCGKAEYFPSGEDFFEDVLEKLKKAQKFIFMDFFILKEGHLANAIFEILIEKAKAGVDVRIIADGLGSHGTLSRRRVRRIRKLGIKIIAFEPVLPVINFFMNYRNHRKIIVIDGKTGYTGGTNIADEYINAKSRFGVWKDASIRIEGDAVKSLTLMFLRMWQYSTREKPDYGLISAAKTGAAASQSCVITPYADGPSEKQKLGKGVYANIIAGAQSYLYIMTPYFIIDSHLTDMLKAKALSGVDVRIVIPGIPDKKIVYALTHYNAQKLISSGVRIYTYTPGFLHSKVMLSDDECAVVGSINMDFRSFYQQYESAVYISDTVTITQIRNDFTNTFAVSRELTLENTKRPNMFKRIVLAFLRLFSPLM